MEEILLSLVAEFYCAAHKIAVSKTEIDDAIVQIRRDKRLITEQDTLNWLSVTGISDDDLRHWATRLALLDHFRDAIANKDEIDRYFAFNRLKFDEVELYKIVVSSSTAARELRAQLLEGESFFELAQKHSVDQATRAKCGYLGRVRREQLAAEVQSHVFAKDPAQIIGPFKIATSHHLYRVEKVFRAELTDPIRDEIAEFLLSEWIVKSLEDWLETSGLGAKQ